METVTPPTDPDLSHSGRRIGPWKSPQCATAFGSLPRTIAAIALACLSACKPTLVVGDYQCLEGDADGGPSSTDPIAIPWETGFENGPCDYARAGGFCYRFPPVSFRLVDSPVHTGKYAAEITVVTGTDGGSEPQGRCALDGALPVEAYYGAWFLIPRRADNSGLWNLFHFRTDPPNAGLWDVHLINPTNPDGTKSENLILELYSRFLPSSNARFSDPIPIGSWFHVVLYLKRAKDSSGAVALYLAEQKVVEFTNLVTDDSDWGQWYVGNLATAVNPPESTVYVDDVSIRSSL